MPPKTKSPSPAPFTPDVTTTRSSESSQEATEADRRQARQILSAEGAHRKTGWLLLRSTGPNLTAVLHNAGATGLTVHQMYNFHILPEWRVHCFIMLYKWSPDRGEHFRWNPQFMPSKWASHSAMEDDSGRAASGDIMFCGQTLDNASATQALIMAILNIPDHGGGEHVSRRQVDDGEWIGSPFDIGPRMRVLKEFMKPMDPVIRAAVLCSSTAVREAHNSAASRQIGGHPEVLDEDCKVRSTFLADELWMYSVFVPDRNRHYVYELEGMADEAKVVATCSMDDGESWAHIMRHPIHEKIEVFREHNTPFTLFAVTSELKPVGLPRIPRKGRPSDWQTDSRDARTVYEKEDGEIDSTNSDEDNMDDDEDDEVDSDEDEEEKLTVDEVKRRQATHNYETFFVEMMKLMASRGDINSLIMQDEAGVETSSEE